jgi:hypothetical protein
MSVARPSKNSPTIARAVLSDVTPCAAVGSFVCASRAAAISFAVTVEWPRRAQELMSRRNHRSSGRATVVCCNECRGIGQYQPERTGKTTADSICATRLVRALAWS